MFSNFGSSVGSNIMPSMKLGLPTMQQSGGFTGFKSAGSGSNVYQGLGGIGSYQSGFSPQGYDLSKDVYDDQNKLVSAKQGDWLGGQVGGTFVPTSRLSQIQNGIGQYNPNPGNIPPAGPQPASATPQPYQSSQQMQDELTRQAINAQFGQL